MSAALEILSFPHEARTRFIRRRADLLVRLYGRRAVRADMALARYLKSSDRVDFEQWRRNNRKAGKAICRHSMLVYRLSVGAV